MPKRWPKRCCGPTMRFVPIKSNDQLDLQALHRVRDRLISRRTGVINQLRALLLERGATFRKGRSYLRRQMPQILEDADQNLSPPHAASPRTTVGGMEESKYPPAEPGALGCEPLKAARRGR